MTDNLLDGFDDLADQIEDQRKQRLRAVAVSTGGQRPDDAARANDIAGRRGLPFGVVADNLQDFHEQDRLDGLDAVGQRAPVVGQFLSDPRRMALAGDEAPGLERLSGSLAGTREPEDMGFFHRTIRNLLPISDSTYNNTVGATLDYIGARFQVADAKMFSTAAQSLGRVLSFANSANRLTADLYQREATAAGARGDTDRQDALMRAAAAFRDPIGVERFASGAKDFTRDLTAQQQALGSQSARPASVRAAIDAPGNSLRYYGGMLADSVPAMLFAMVTRNPEAGAAAMGATTGMQTYADRVNEGASDMQALREGAAQGGLEAVGSVIPLSHAFGGGARRFITTPLSEALSEGVTQAAQMDAEDLLQGKQTPTSEKLAQVLDAMIVGGPMGLIEAAGGGGPSHAQQRAFGEQVQQAVASADHVAQLQDITTAAAETRLVERSPADAEAFVAASGAGDARVYLPADAVATLFQSSPGTLEEAVGGPEALAEQMATGDITIPMAKWVSVVSRMPNVDEIRRHARLSADGMSEIELEKFNPEAIAQELGIGTEPQAGAAPAPEAAAQVQADVYAQLLATQRYTPAQAEAQAKLWGAAFGRLGEMTGQDPQALYRQRMAGIQTEADATARGATSLAQGQVQAEPAAGAALRARWATDFDAAAAEYAALTGKFDSRGGVVLNTDLAREMSPEYRADRTRSADVHEAASDFVKEMYRRKLEAPTPAGLDPVVLFTAGGTGAGKTTGERAIAAAGAIGHPEIVYDTNMNRLESSDKKIQQALGAGRKVKILYTYRDPVDALTNGALPRAMRMAAEHGTGRTVPLAEHAKTHQGAYRTIKALAEKYRTDDRVEFFYFDNSRGKDQGTFVQGIENLPNMEEDSFHGRTTERPTNQADASDPSRGTAGTLRTRLWQALDAERAAGRISEDVYRGFAGQPVEDAQRLGPDDRRQPQPADRQQVTDQTPPTGGVSASEPGILRRAFDSVRRFFQTPAEDSAPRGQIDVFPDRRMAISLFQSADLSTFLHESGHFFLEVYRDAATAEGASPQLRADFDVLNAWLGRTGGMPPVPEGKVRVYHGGSMSDADTGEVYFSTDRAYAEGYRKQNGGDGVYWLDIDESLLERDLAMGLVGRNSIALPANEARGMSSVSEASQPFTTEQHEQFARGFEAYLGEGRAPSADLQSVFSQFRAWLLGVYRTLAGLKVQLTDEVRGVFDRMLATEAEIEVAQAKSGVQPLARTASEAAQLGLTEKQFSDYQRMLAAAADEARAEVQQKLEEAHNRERERWWKDEAEKVREEVQAEIEAQPAVRARRILSGAAEAAGEPVPPALQGMKLDRAALVADYGAGHLKKLGRVYTREGGIHPDEAAAMLGFSSGDELVQGLWGVDQALAAIPDEVRRRMHERHGNPMTDGTLPALALEAVHNSKRAQVLDREMAVLAQLAGEPRPSRRELRAVAEDVVARKTDRQIRPNDYLVAERRAAADSARAAAGGDYGTALLAKRRQALNAALYAAARRAKDEIAGKASDIRKQSEGKARERLGLAGADYLDAMDALTEAFEFRPVSGREVARRQSLRAWVEARQADDDLTAVSDALLARVETERVTNYQDMTLAELRELHDAVTNIAHLARLKNELLKGKDKREWKVAQAEMAGAIRGALAERAPVPFSDADRTVMQSVGAAYEGLLDWVVRPETVVEWLDGGEAGPWHDYLWNQAEAAQQLRIDYRNKVGGMLADMAAAMTSAQRADLQRKVYIQGLERSVSRNTIVALALNMGNAGNRDKLMRGGYLADGRTIQFTPTTVAEMLGHLTPADGQMIQRIWDAVDSLWPDIEAQQKRLSGVAPERIEPMPLSFTGAGGAQISLRGGYYPAVYDPRASRGGTQQARAAEERVMGGTFSRAMTSKGHTKERSDYAAPMLLDYHAVLSRHLNDVITDLSHRGYVKQALRVLEDGELKGLIIERLSEGAYHSLYGSVKNSVAGASIAEPGSKMAEKLADAVLTNTAVAALGFRIPLVMANAVVAPIQAAARVDLKYLATGYTAYYRNPAAATRAIHDLSPFMLERADSLDSTYQQVLGKLTGKKGMRAAAMKMAMEVHRWVVPLSERAIWLGRYQQALAEGAGPADAVLLADKSIRQTQQAGAPKDMSAAERDPRYKWVRMFIGPMIIMNNRLQESGLRGLYLGRVQSPARALGTWLSAAVLSNAVFELMMGRAPGGDDDDDGAGAEDWAAWLARKSLLFPFQTFPLLRDVASAVDAAMEGKQQSSRPNPIVDAGVALAKFGQAAWKEGHDWFAEDDEVEAEKLIKTGVRAAGPVTGLPSNQMLTTGEYLYDVGTGQYTPDNPAEAAAYLMYRRPMSDK
ncbi:zeta toxin family protein [Xanthomonas albilineans]|uniref:zeta toxin family protein n=1 Tax=Xanthomonas albilineans TaxID=29447 RepID=UPI0005F3156A|nr:zeta toxin family protein [Xanthomonas albilineans]